MTLDVLVVLAVSVPPGLAWLWFFRRYDTYRPTLLKFVGITFIAGGISTIPAGLLEWFLIEDSIFDEGLEFSSIAIQMLAIVGPVEEFSKFAAVGVLTFIFSKRYINEPAQGMVLSAAASLGFATVENAVYVIDYGPWVMIGRGPLSTLGHAIFGAFWGYALALHLMSGRKRPWLVVGGLASAATVHALFNIGLFLFPLASLALIVLGAVWAISRFRWAKSASPFRLKRNVPLVACYVCTRLVRSGSKFCRHCGVEDPDSNQLVQCGNCGGANAREAKFCVSCGDRFVTA